jgi:anion transporter
MTDKLVNSASSGAEAIGTQPNFLIQHKHSIGLIIALIIGVVFWVTPSIGGLSQAGTRILGSLLVWIILLLIEIADAAVITILWLIFLVVTRLTKMDVAFQGFSNNTTWLLIGAMMIGVAASKTGLAKRIAYYILTFSGEKYKSLTIWLMVSGAILGAIMPSGTARMAVYIPIYMGLCEVMQVKKNSNTAVNLAFFMIWSASIGAGSMMWLTGSVLNPIMTDALVPFGVDITWTRYAIFAIPSAVILSVVLYYSINWVVPPEDEIIIGGKEVIKKELTKLGKTSSDEKKSLTLFLACIVLWVFGSSLQKLTGLYLHNSVVAVVFGCLLFFPKIGVLEGKDFNKVSWNAVFFIGSSLAISSIMQAGGVDKWAGENLVVPIMAPFMNFGFIGVVIGLYIVCHILHILIPSGTGTVALAVPILVGWGLQNGINAELMGHLTLHGMRPFLFPFEHTPAVLVFGFGFMTMGKFFKVGLISSLACVIWYVISAYYWQLLV